MTIEEYIQTLKDDPPKHLVRDGQVWCPVCGQEPPQVKRIMSRTGIFPCEKCTAAQSNHKPFAPVSLKEKMDSLSPEEVMSGVQHGGMNQFGKNSKRGWIEEHKEEVKNALEALS